MILVLAAAQRSGWEGRASGSGWTKADWTKDSGRGAYAWWRL